MWLNLPFPLTPELGTWNNAQGSKPLPPWTAHAFFTGFEWSSAAKKTDHILGDTPVAGTEA